MNQLELFAGKKCVLCGRYFEVDRRVEKRQKCCHEVACQRKRKRMRDKVWRLENPGYFQNRSDYVKAWRQKHPGYQKARRRKKALEIQVQIPAKTPMKSIRLHLRCKLRLGEIQAQMLRVTQVGQAFWVDGATTQAA
jgi:hypothetical protein